MAIGESISTPVDTSRVVDLDEVIIVAQPKEQVRLRQQPLSSNVFGAAEMQRLNVRDLSQLSQYVPSFTMPAYGSRLTSSLYVRGIGSRINNPAVSVYYDNISLMSKAAFNTHFYMLDRVDILRGPQGTLYGMNTEGGLVRVYSKDPMNYQGTDINLGIGTGFYRNVEVAHYHRPSERLAFSAAGFYSGQNGFIDNQNFSAKNDKANEAGGKGHLIWLPNEQLKVDWTTDYQYTNQNGFGYGEAQLSGQQLLIPETIHLSPVDAARITAALSDIEPMGFKIEPFGRDTFKIDAVPQLIGSLSPADVISTVARDLSEGGAKRGERWREELVAKSIARSFAGMSLALDEAGATKLVEELAACRMPYISPGGKPTMIFTSTRELDRRFAKN